MHEVTWQPSLLGTEQPAFDTTLHGARRRFLGAGAWVDLVPGWVQGSDALFEELLASAPWHAPADRRMYDSIVAVPRLVTGRWEHKPALLRDAARCLSRHYARRLPTITANLYRTGDDSVAWHGDRVGRHRVDTVVGILSLGSSRRFLLRPDGGGPSVGYELHGGDLLVLGGTCQTTWEHCVPKRAHAGPRISVMFRERGGN